MLWQAFLRRFDLEHTFRFFKQVLGWTRPETARPGRRRPLDLARHRLLRPAPPRPALAADLRLPWQQPRPARPTDPRAGSAAGSATSARHLPCPQPRRNPANPAPDARQGSKNRRPAPRHDVGKTHPKTGSEAKRRASEAQVAVGTALAGGPPRRSQRAGLPHWAPVMSTWQRTACQAMDALSWSGGGNGWRCGSSAPM